MNTIDLEVEGMSCGSCVRKVKEALAPLPGVSGIDVDLRAGRVRVHGDFVQGSVPLLSALQQAGYPAHVEATSSQASTSSGSNGRCCGD